ASTGSLSPSSVPLFFSLPPRPRRPPLFPYTTLFRSGPFRRPQVAADVGTVGHRVRLCRGGGNPGWVPAGTVAATSPGCRHLGRRSEEHTSELQSQSNLVCRLLLEKKNKRNNTTTTHT